MSGPGPLEEFLSSVLCCTRNVKSNERKEDEHLKSALAKKQEEVRRLQEQVAAMDRTPLKPPADGYPEAPRMDWAAIDSAEAERVGGRASITAKSPPRTPGYSA